MQSESLWKASPSLVVENRDDQGWLSLSGSWVAARQGESSGGCLSTREMRESRALGNNPLGLQSHLVHNPGSETRPHWAARKTSG